MLILVVDGMGGGVGKAVIDVIKAENRDCKIIAVGTNSAATSAMLKAGADVGATGENAVVYNSKKVDYIIGAMGIILSNSMNGEISPKMAQAISESEAHKILLPVSKCSATVVGVLEKPLQQYLQEIPAKLK